MLFVSYCIIVSYCIVITSLFTVFHVCVVDCSYRVVSCRIVSYRISLHRTAPNQKQNIIIGFNNRDKNWGPLIISFHDRDKGYGPLIILLHDFDKSYGALIIDKNLSMPFRFFRTRTASISISSLIFYYFILVFVSLLECKRNFCRR